MRIKFLLIYMLLLVFCSITVAEKYVRYNYAGYFPKSAKRIIVMSENESAGAKWEIKDQTGAVSLNGTLGNSIFGKGDFTPMKYNYQIDFSSMDIEGKYTLSLDGAKDAVLNISKNPYGNVIHENLRYLRVMRAGSNDVLDRKPAHFGDTSCYVYRREGEKNTDEWKEDKNGKKVNMLGGWYDAFVYTKFTLTNAYTAYLLLRAYEINPSLFEKRYSKSGLIDILDEAKWALDYLLKTMPDDNEFIMQVGGFADNERGVMLPEKDKLDGKREAYSIFSGTQMGNVAAALALGSVVFAKKGIVEDAEKYKAMAVKVFNKAISKKASNAAWLEKDYDLYKDSSANDNLLLAATELYRLTKEKKYLTHAKKYAKLAKNSWWVSYADLNMIAHLRLMDEYSESKKHFLTDMNEFFGNSQSKGNIWAQPLEYTFQSIYSYIAIASSAYLYQMATSDTKYREMAVKVLDYVFGCNNWGLSFVSSKTFAEKSVKNYYSQIYMLQTHLFPSGAVASGPLDAKTHDEESKWCYFDQRAQPTYKFNTSKGKFFDHGDDYMCTGPAIYGVGEAVLLQSLVTKIYGE